MADMEKRSFDTPDERRAPPNCEIASVSLGGRVVSRVTYFPGFRWTTDLRPVMGTDLCQGDHFLYVVSGRCHVAMAGSGGEMEFGPGDIGVIHPGHDAWVLGDAPFVCLDFGAAVKPA